MVFMNICVVNSFITTLVFPKRYSKEGERQGILIHLGLKLLKVELNVIHAHGTSNYSVECERFAMESI